VAYKRGEKVGENGTREGKTDPGKKNLHSWFHLPYAGLAGALWLARWDAAVRWKQRVGANQAEAHSGSTVESGRAGGKETTWPHRDQLASMVW